MTQLNKKRWENYEIAKEKRKTQTEEAELESDAVGGLDSGVASTVTVAGLPPPPELPPPNPPPPPAPELSILPSIHAAHLRSTQPSKSNRRSPMNLLPEQSRPIMAATTPKTAITARTPITGPMEPLLERGEYACC